MGRITKPIIASVLCIIIVLITTFSVYLPYKADAERLEIEISVYEEEVRYLKSIQAKVPIYEERIELMTVVLDEFQEKTPKSINDEDMLIWILAMLAELQLDTDVITISQKEAGESAVYYMQNVRNVLSSYEVELGFTTSYTQLKRLINYINDYPYVTTINNIIVMPENENETKLNVSISFEKFALDNPSKEETHYDLPEVVLGVNNIFNTGNIYFVESYSGSGSSGMTGSDNNFNSGNNNSSSNTGSTGDNNSSSNTGSTDNQEPPKTLLSLDDYYNEETQINYVLEWLLYSTKEINGYSSSENYEKLEPYYDCINNNYTCTCNREDCVVNNIKENEYLQKQLTKFLAR